MSTLTHTIIVITTALWMALLSPPSLAGDLAPQAISNPNRASLIERDARLAHTFTFGREQARIEEIFEAIEKQTGISLIADDRDGAAGEIVTIYVQDMPVADLMSALWSLVSFQNAEWRWVTIPASTPNASPRYRLERTATAREFPQSVKDRIQRYMEAVMEANIDSASSTSPDPADKQFPETMAHTEREKRKANAFAALCPPEMRLRLMRGEINKIQIPRSQWPPAMQAYVDAEIELKKSAWASHPELHNLIPYHTPNPQLVTVYRDNDIEDLFPALMMVTDAMGGFSVAGGVQTAGVWNKWVSDNWMLPGDLVDDATQETRQCAKTVPQQSAFPEDDVPGVSLDWSQPMSPAALKEFHALTHLPVLARTFDYNHRNTQDLRGQTVASVSDTNLRKQLHLFLKWRDGVLLATDSGWLKHAAVEEQKATRVPWATVKQFRAQTTAAENGAPSLSAICSLADSLTADQMDEMQKAGNLMPPAMAAELDGNYPSLQPLLSALGRNPEMLNGIQDGHGIIVRSLPPRLQTWAADILHANGIAHLSETLRLRVRQDDSSRLENIKSISGETATLYRQERLWTFEFLDKTPPASATEAALGSAPDRSVIALTTFYWVRRVPAQVPTKTGTPGS